MDRVLAIVLACTLAAVGLLPTAAGATAHAVYAQSRVSLDQAVSIARAEVQGKVIGAETRERRGRVVHQVKILTPDGTVRTVRVDGDTGRIIR